MKRTLLLYVISLSKLGVVVSKRPNTNLVLDRLKDTTP